MQIVVVTSLQELAGHEDAWNRLALATPYHLPVLSYAWIATYLEHRLMASEQWLCILVYDGSELVGVLPIIVTEHTRFGRHHVVLKTPHDLHTVSASFLVAQNRQKDVLSLILSALRRKVPHMRELTMRRLPDDSPAFVLMQDRVQSSRIVREFDGLGSYIEVRGSFDDYVASLSSNMRRNLRKLERKLATLSDVRTVFVSGTEASADHYEKFLSVESSGWKGQQMTAIAACPATSAFYEALTRRLARLGRLEWQFLEADNKIIAGHMAFRIGHSLTIYKIGYDESYASCGPGTLLFYRTVERAFESGEIREINCLTDMSWHDNWRMSKRAYFNLIVYPGMFSKVLFHSIPQGSRSLVKSIPGVNRAVRLVRSIKKS